MQMTRLSTPLCLSRQTRFLRRVSAEELRLMMSTILAAPRWDAESVGRIMAFMDETCRVLFRTGPQPRVTKLSRNAWATTGVRRCGAASAGAGTRRGTTYRCSKRKRELVASATRAEEMPAADSLPAESEVGGDAARAWLTR